MHSSYRFRTIRPAQAERRRRRLVIEGVILVKCVVMVGLIAGYFLPPVHAAVVGIVANLLWLWRT